MHTYGQVVLEDVYPGIDWVIYTKDYTQEGGLKYDFKVSAGADPALIRLKVTDAAVLAGDGALTMKLRLAR